MTRDEFVDGVLQLARVEGYPVRTNRDGLLQIDFGHKQLHEGHLRRLYPEILRGGANIPGLINRIAPGRPCVHKPMKAIIGKLAIAGVNQAIA
jgi:hypothetical protein